MLSCTPGEVYVLNDGGEVDLDLGNYERYLNVTLSKDNNITTGKIYREVIEKEVRNFSFYNMEDADPFHYPEKRRISRQNRPGASQSFLILSLVILPYELDRPTRNQRNPRLD